MIRCVTSINVVHVIQYHLKAILIGVVRQEVNKSAGNSGFIGNICVPPQAASCMQFRKLGGDPLFCCKT